jgi:hypothetical protein
MVAATAVAAAMVVIVFMKSDKSSVYIARA